MPNQFRDNPSKRVVREKWDTPVLRHLHSTYGVRYRYMGLPGVDLIDIKLWKDMIDEIIAFEPPDDSLDRRESIKTLRRNMKLLGLPGVAYYGSLEEVVYLRQDWDGQPYSQKNVITLYNFDFCDEIGSRISTRNRGKKVWRFEAIRQVLRDQIECYNKNGGPNYFVLMLTVRNQIDAKKIRDFLSTRLLAEAKDFHQECERKNPLPLSGSINRSCCWALKAFLFDLLCKNFSNPNLSAVFFPLVLYTGTTASSPMIHWLILCRFARPENPAPEFFPDPYLRCSSVGIKNGALIWAPQTGETDGDSKPPDGVRWLTDFGGVLLNGLKTS